MTGFASSPRFVDHDTGPLHPERPDRIRAIYAALHGAGLIDSQPFPAFQHDFGALPQAGQKLVELNVEPADERWLHTVHSGRHIGHVQHICEAGGGMLDMGDTVVGPESFEIAMLAVGAVLGACDAVMRGEIRRCFASVRPPGHHAEPGKAMGFCLFNNIAIASRYLQKSHGLERIAIVDFDVHHGNGTQAATEMDPNVYFISLHQSPRTCYPGSGYEWETGTGRGEGYTLNLPMDAGAGDAEYINAMESRVMPELDKFRPQFLLVSAGFDAHRDDPLAALELTEESYEQMTRMLTGLADRHCQGRLVSVLEGGYDLRALGRSVVRHVMALQT